MAKRRRPPPPNAAATDSADSADNPTHPLQTAFFKRLKPLLRQPDGANVPLFREAQVPSRPTHIDALIDFHGIDLHGGLMQPLARWCENRIVALEYDSGEVDAEKLSMMMAKAATARVGRNQGTQRWPMVEPSESMTLLLVAEQARPVWFVRWGLEFREICSGLWVLERPLVTIVVLRPLWFGKHPGAHLWTLVANKLSRRAADRLFEHLLGDESIATFYKLHAAAELQERFPTSLAMNQHQTQTDSAPEPDYSDSLWHRLLEEHLARKALEAESVALKRVAEEASAEAEQQRAEAEQQRAEAEQQRALVRQLQAELEKLKSRG